MKVTNRGAHRDVAYFFLGLIISFSISGIMLNHRRVWNPTKYVTELKPMEYSIDTGELTDERISQLVTDFRLNDDVRGYRLRDSILTITLVKSTIRLNVETKKGEIEFFRKTPLVSQFYTLHKSTSDWWIYYSDIFGMAMLLLAATGLFMYPKDSKYGFKKRGWKLGLAGIIFPLIFLFLLA